MQVGRLYINHKEPREVRSSGEKFTEEELQLLLESEQVEMSDHVVVEKYKPGLERNIFFRAYYGNVLIIS